ncbi:MAG TPA: 3-oxoacyl-[acyl-carrier-protein] reductase [Elusimicrobiota bacterium]|nr:3-oxoacyl-[acyl-carrier-protein] reductase [Elusimicrobiota bacterium]
MAEQATMEPQKTGRLRLENKVAVITGAARGIGFATAELFCREGAKVVLVDLDEALVKESAAKAAAAPDQTMGLKADVSKFADCEAVVKAVVEKYGKLDILINNAGITKDNLILRMSEADWDLVLGINLRGAFNFTKAAVRPMLKARYGRVVNVASVVGQEGNAGQANYSASKGGLISLTKSCAREFASRNILVNAVAPGFIRTRLTDVIPEADKEMLAKKILVGRLGEPIDISNSILFLASDEASYITGHVLNVNGGGYM